MKAFNGEAFVNENILVKKKQGNVLANRFLIVKEVLLTNPD